MKVLKYLSVSVFLLAVTASTASAVRLVNPLGDGVTFEKAISNVISGALGVSGVLALVAFVYGGVVWMVSGGNDAKITKGKNIMVWAIFGLIIIFSSYAILSAVFDALLGTGTPSSGGVSTPI
jgi:hypothetical protein